MSGIGLIGELKVVDVLEKKLGVDIYVPMKDKGIDFIGVKNDLFYQIQVKTSKFQKESYFWFDLYKSKMHYSENTFYIFVCRGISPKKYMGKMDNFLIIPSLTIKKWINDGLLAVKKNDSNVINFFVYPNEKEKTWEYKGKGKKISLTPYWNEFGLLKNR